MNGRGAQLAAAFVVLAALPTGVTIEGVSRHTELTRPITGSEDALTLTVDRRDGFWWGPALLLAAGLLVGLLAAIVPKWLTARVHKLLVNHYVRQNATGDEDPRSWA